MKLKSAQIQALDQVHAQVWNQIHTRVRGQVYDQVCGQISRFVISKDQIWDQLYEAQ
jgi:hypothetical protein